MNEKFVLTEETKEYDGHTLRRIKALKDFGDVKAGDLGGFIEKEENLSQGGDARVSGDAEVLWITGIGSRKGTTTVCREKNGGLIVSCGCFLGNLDAFSAKVEETHGDNKYGREYKAFIEVVKAHFDIKE